MKADLVLRSYFDAGYPAVAVETLEEGRLLRECKALGIAEKLFTIAAVGGMTEETGASMVKDATSNFTKAFQFISKTEESMLMVYDFQHMISSPTAYRPLIQALSSCKARGAMVVLVAPFWRLPEELKHIIPVIKTELPSLEELRIPLQAVLDSTNKKLENHEDLLNAARGLTLSQAEDVFALSSKQNFSREIVEGEKMKLVRAEYMGVEKPRDESKLAGLGQLKTYIREEVLTSKDDPQLMVKGIALVGVPGTGKSLSAKVIASLLKWPLLRLDIAAAKGSLVGQSESNIRKGLATADAISPCVLWLDEIEKAVGGHASSAQTDGGTTLGMVGTLLTWMQEHESSVLVVATCNDYAKLPQEMTRAGRFDEKFFLDLPSSKEREQVAQVHLQNLGCDLIFADAIAEFTEEWTGAEIEQLIKSAARRTRRKLTLEAIEHCKSEIIPISRTVGIKNLRDWASTNLRRANDAEEIVTTSRRMRSH